MPLRPQLPNHDEPVYMEDGHNYVFASAEKKNNSFPCIFASDINGTSPLISSQPIYCPTFSDHNLVFSPHASVILFLFLSPSRQQFAFLCVSSHTHVITCNNQFHAHKMMCIRTFASNVSRNLPSVNSAILYRDDDND